MTNVLILSNVREEREALRQVVIDEGAHAVCAGSLAEARKRLRNNDFRLVLAVHHLPQAGATEIADAIRAAAERWTARLIALPGHGPIAKRELAEAGFDDVLRAPLDPADIALLIQSAARAPDYEPADVSDVDSPDMSILRRLSLDLAWSTALDQQARHGLEAAMQALGAERGAIWLRNHEDRTIRCLAQSGLSANYAFQGGTMFNYFGHDDWVEMSRHPTFDAAPRRLSGPAGELAQAEAISTTLTTALFTPSRVLGALVLYDVCAEESEPDEESLGLVEAIAAITAMALDQTQLRNELGASEDTYRQLVEEMPLGVFVHDPQGNFLMSNAAIESICGYGADELALMSIFDLLDGGPDGPSGQLLTDILAEITAQAALEFELLDMVGPLELIFLAADGRRIEAETYFRPVRLANRNNELWIQAMARDVTSDSRALRELEALRLVAETLADASDIHDALGNVLVCINEPVPNLHASAWLVSPDGKEIVCRAQTGIEFTDMLRDARALPLGLVIESGRPLHLTDIQSDADAWPVHPQAAQLAAVPVLVDERMLGVIQVQTGEERALEERDIDFLGSVAAQIAGRLERLALQREIERKESVDPVTGLDNRTTFQRKLAAIFDNAAGQPVSLLIVGIDRFKAINDIYGPIIADALLGQLGSTIQSYLDAPFSAARYSGDEFAVTLPGVGRDEVTAIAETIRIGIATQLFTAQDQLEQLTVSIGAATAPDDAATVERLVAAASHATFLAKQSGRNQVYQSNAAFAELALHHGRITDLLRQAPKETLSLLVQAMDQRLPERKGHAERVTRFSLAIGRELGMESDDLDQLRVAALIHDIGMFLIPDALLRKPVKLSESEREMFSAVPAAAHRLLSQISLPPEITLAVVHQHEHWDGSGYPARLNGETIPLASRIIAVADALDAMTSERAHRESISMPVALDRLLESSGAQFDPRVVTTALFCFGDVDQPLPDSNVGTIDEALLLVGD